MRRNSDYQKKYGITVDQWDQLFSEQGYVCAACGADKPGTKLNWHTDHNHLTGKVRGIVCHRCNIVLGLLGDSELEMMGLVAKLQEYLRGAA